MRFSGFGRVVVMSGILAASLCGCQGESSAVRTDADAVPVANATDVGSEDTEDYAKQYDDMMSQYDELYKKSLAAVYDGDAPKDYAEFAKRLGLDTDDPVSSSAIISAMGMGLVSEGDGNAPDFKGYGLASVVSHVFSSVNFSFSDNLFDWNAEDAITRAQDIYDSVRLYHSSMSDVNSQKIMFAEMANEAGLDESAYKDVIARDDIIVNICTDEIERICDEHGIKLDTGEIKHDVVTFDEDGGYGSVDPNPNQLVDDEYA